MRIPLSKFKKLQLRPKIKVFQLLLLATAFVLSPMEVFSQQKTVSGQITDDTGASLPGANVLIKGTTDGTVTDIEGNYSLNAAAEDILVISSVGFVSQEILVGNQSTISPVMATDVQQLEELVVTGYSQ